MTLLYLSHHPYIIQDDARQHVVFLQRLVNPQLFSHDLIADYFETMAPAGYKLLYWGAAKLGIMPIEFAKILPLGLSLITTAYLYSACLQLFPIPLSGFLATLILNQQLWMRSDLVSATPRAFVYPIFAAFLYYLLRRSILLCLFTIVLQSLFFPQLVFVQILILLMLPFVSPQTQDQHHSNYRFAILGLLVGGLAILPYRLHISTFGAAITAEQMRQLPEYGLHGRNQYFGVSFWRFWLLGNSGLRIPWFPSLILSGLALPWLQRPELRTRLPLLQRLTPQVRILWQVLLASGIMYGLAHLLLLKLHFPSRYTYHTLRIVLAMAAGIVLTVLLDAGWRWLQQQQWGWQKYLLMGITGLVAATVLIVPALPPLFVQFQGWIRGDAPALYQYLATQPPETRIASLTPAADNLPAFTARSTLVGREFALPHHPSYYNQFKQQTVDLIQAQYSSERSRLSQFIDQYQIDFLLLEQGAFSPSYLLRQNWLMQSSLQGTVFEIVAQLQQGSQPVLASLLNQCGMAFDPYVLVQASCVQEQAVSPLSSRLGR